MRSCRRRHRPSSLDVWGEEVGFVIATRFFSYFFISRRLSRETLRDRFRVDLAFEGVFERRLLREEELDLDAANIWCVWLGRE